MDALSTKSPSRKRSNLYLKRSEKRKSTGRSPQTLVEGEGGHASKNGKYRGARIRTPCSKYS
jgi:hypothetical protein